MIGAIVDFFTLPARFRKLQADHDLRAALNSRLQRHCALQAKEIKRLTRGKGSRANQEPRALAAAYEEFKALRHINYMRVEVQRRMLADLLPLSSVIEVQNRVDQMSDEEVIAYRAPKREVMK